MRKLSLIFTSLLILLFAIWSCDYINPEEKIPAYIAIDTAQLSTISYSQGPIWEIKIPEDFDVITYRIVAKAGNFTDGEENAIPVLSNRILVTESLPMPVKGKETKKFKLKKLITSGHAMQESNGQILKNHKQATV